jgi:2-keto-4-pentenoate hydratase
MSDDRRIAEALAAGRKSGEKLAAYPGSTPRDKAHAFAIQTMARELLGWERIGWKCGCTSQRAQESLGTDAPFPGSLYRERLFESGSHLATHASNSRVTEPEIAFTMARDLKPRGKPYDVADVLAAVESVQPSIEVVNPRLPKGFGDVVEWYIADGALNDSIVLGKPVKPLPREAYAKLRVQAKQNGKIVGEGTGAEALGGPEIVLTWLANDLIDKGLYLRAGDVVSTGVVVGVFTSNLGDRVEANYDHLGSISVKF